MDHVMNASPSFLGNQEKVWTTPTNAINAMKAYRTKPGNQL